MPESITIKTSVLNTGRISFDENLIKGFGTESSDEEGLSTIKLVPDFSKFGANQYLILEPILADTSVHLRTAGEWDYDSPNFVLGAYKTNITLSDLDDNRVSIKARNVDGDASYLWGFTNVGSTAFPTLLVDLHTGGVSSVEAIQFSDNSKKSVITGPTPATGEIAKPIIVQGQSQTGNTGGDVYLWGGDSTTDGGDIEILAGNNEGSAGYAGGVTIRGGSFANGTGGSVAITGGTGTTHGEVQIVSNSNSWTFNNDGNLTIPAVKDILDPSSNSLTGGGNRVVIYDSASGSVVATTGNIYVVDSATAPIGITLPNSTVALIRPGYNFTVVDKTGHASTNNIQVVAGVGDSIVSAPSGVAIDTDYGALSLKYLGDKSWAIMYGR